MMIRIGTNFKFSTPQYLPLKFFNSLFSNRFLVSLLVLIPTL